MSTPPDREKRYVIRKSVMAKNLQEAIASENNSVIEEVFLDEEKKDSVSMHVVGFRVETESDINSISTDTHFTQSPCSRILPK